MAESQIPFQTTTGNDSLGSFATRRAGSTTSSLATLIRSAAEGIRPELPRGVRVDLRIDETAFTGRTSVPLDALLWDLLRNACQSMRRSGGTLTIVAGRPHRPLPADLDPNARWVCITIGDTGAGMDPSVLDHVQRDGHPDGGIARARRTLAEAGGVLHLNSWPGGGTVVRLFLRSPDSS